MKVGNDPMPIFVKAEDRFKPTFIVGPTGSGKSVLALNIWQNDSYSQVAKILIDPAGVLAREAYAVMKGKCHYISINNRMGLNPMLSPYEPFQVADIITQSLNQMVVLTTPNEKLTVKMLEILNVSIVWCLERGRTTLEEVKANIEVQKGHAETRDGVLARLNLILQDPSFKEIVCGQGFEINKLIENQRSLVIDCSGLSEPKQVFIGTLVTNLTKAYFLYAKPKKYKPLIITIDECHNFIDLSFINVVKQARKYKIASILLTTDFSMMPNSLIHTLLSNAGTLITTRAGHIEAQRIASEFTTVRGENIQSLEKYHAYVKTPEGEHKVKLPRPLYVKEIPITSVKTEKRDFTIQWFNLPHSYRFQLDYDPDGAVVGDDFKHKSETPPPSTSEAMLNADGDCYVPATGKAQSVSSDGLCLKGM